MRHACLQFIRILGPLALAVQGTVPIAMGADGPMMTLCLSDGRTIEVPFPLDDDDAPQAPSAELHGCHVVVRDEREGRGLVKGVAG